MTTVTIPIPIDSLADKDKLVHSCCFCSPNLSLCGRILTGEELEEEVEVDCVVCAELDPLPCPKCGEV